MAKQGRFDRAMDRLAKRVIEGKTPDVQGRQVDDELRGLIDEQSKKDKENPK